MKNKIEEWELSQILGIINMQSLDSVVQDTDGELVSLHETIGNSDDYNFIALKCFLLNVAKTQTEKKVIELLSQQYGVEDIAKHLHFHKDSIRAIIYALRKRCQKYGLVIKTKKKKKR
jgi:diphthamide synthase subunit DPH2